MSPSPSASTDPSAHVLAVNFSAIGTTCRIVVTDAASLIPAQTVAQQHLAALDAAASRFRPDSELMRLCAQAQDGPVRTRISALLSDYLQAALRVAQLTEGLVDPSVGSALQQRGYDQDMDLVRQRQGFADPAPGQIPGWQQIEVDAQARRVSIAQGVVIDLGASAKAHAADTIAALLSARLPGGFIVDLGGDIAVSGSAPGSGWRIGISDPYAIRQQQDQTQAEQNPRQPNRFTDPTLQTIKSTGQAIATSSTQLRTWRSATAQHHHIIDPRTGRSAEPVWLQTSCAAANALEANAATTAAIILGEQAPQWLAQRGVMALLAAREGSLTLTDRWPDTDLRTDRAWQRVQHDPTVTP